jgi:RNA recognition motif
MGLRSLLTIFAGKLHQFFSEIVRSNFYVFSKSTSFSISQFPHLQDESSVQNLIENCIIEDEKLYICVSSPTIKNKPVQIRPWRLSDADFVLDASMSLDPRKTVFVGGVPRPLKARKFFEIFLTMNFFLNYDFKLNSGACHDYGPIVWRCLLRWHRHRSRIEVSKGKI